VIGAVRQDRKAGVLRERPGGAGQLLPGAADKESMAINRFPISELDTETTIRSIATARQTMIEVARLKPRSREAPVVAKVRDIWRLE